MNIVLLEPHAAASDHWNIDSERQIGHLMQHLAVQVGDTLKVGIRGGARYRCEVLQVKSDRITVRPLQREPVPAKLPVSLIVALPRPKVLRRLIMDSVTLGVEQIILLHSYRVDKSYWQSPFLQQLDSYVTLGLEQAGDTHAPPLTLYKRFKPFVEDVLPTLLSDERPAYVAHPYSDGPMPSQITHPCSVIIGPEGGFIPYEVELLTQNGAQAVQLGTRILRTETAIPYVLGRLFGSI